MRPKSRTELIRPFEQSSRLARAQHGIRRDFDGHHRVTTAIEQLSTVPRPDRLVAAFGRDRQFLTGVRKLPDLNLITTRFARHVRDASTVRRERRRSLDKRRLEKRGCLSLATCSKDPEILRGTTGYGAEQKGYGSEQQGAGARPREGIIRPLPRHESLLRTAPVQWLPVHVVQTGFV